MKGFPVFIEGVPHIRTQWIRTSSERRTQSESKGHFPKFIVLTSTDEKLIKKMACFIEIPTVHGFSTFGQNKKLMIPSRHFL